MKAGGNRGAELLYLTFEDFEILNENKYLVRFKTKKAQTSRTLEANSAIIAGFLESTITRKYLSCFTQDHVQFYHTVHFFKRLVTMKAVNKPIL
jgi:hypothetical protein